MMAGQAKGALSTSLGYAGRGIGALIKSPYTVPRYGVSKAAGAVVKSFGSTWDNKGWGTATRRALGMGAVLGGATATVDMAMNRPAPDMAISQSGSAYGADGFGSRRTNVRALGDSTTGLVGGLHNAR